MIFQNLGANPYLFLKTGFIFLSKLLKCIFRAYSCFRKFNELPIAFSKGFCNPSWTQIFFQRNLGFPTLFEKSVMRASHPVFKRSLESNIYLFNMIELPYNLLKNNREALEDFYKKSTTPSPLPTCFNMKMKKNVELGQALRKK